jgi:hypothetical protein
LICTSDSNQPVVWYRRLWNYYSKSWGKDEIGSHDTSYKTEALGNGEFRLIIPMITTHHAGVYACCQGNECMVHEITFWRNVTFEAGQLVELKCPTGFGDQNVVWYFHKSGVRFPVSTKGRIEVTFKGTASLKATDNGEFNLVLNRAALNNSGTYECVESDGLGQTRAKINLNVVLRVGPAQTVPVGQSAILTCATGLQSGTVRWRFKPSDGETIDVSQVDSSHKFVRVANPIVGEHKLVVRNVQFGDAGIYECTDNSGYGQRAEIHISVAPDELHAGLTEVKAGEDVPLYCPVEPHTEAEWVFCPAKERVPCCVLYARNVLSTECNSHAYTTRTYFTFIKLRAVRTIDAGEYYCSEQDGFGRRVSAVKLIVQDEGLFE